MLLLVGALLAAPIDLPYPACTRERGEMVASGVTQSSFGAPLMVGGIASLAMGGYLTAVDDEVRPVLVALDVGAFFAALGTYLVFSGSASVEMGTATDCRRPTPVPGQPPTSRAAPPTPPQAPPIPAKP
jgi:hypothetical protein